MRCTHVPRTSNVRVTCESCVCCVKKTQGRRNDHAEIKLGLISASVTDQSHAARACRVRYVNARLKFSVFDYCAHASVVRYTHAPRTSNVRIVRYTRVARTLCECALRLLVWSPDCKHCPVIHGYCFSMETNDRLNLNIAENSIT